MMNAAQPTPNADEALKLVVEKFKAALPTERSYEFSITPLDRLGLPLWALGLWGEGDTFADGFGYGATLAGAQVGAWGEALENYYSDVSLGRMAQRRASYRALVGEGKSVVDPVSLCLDAGCDYSPERELIWVAGKRYPTGDEVLLPLEAVAASYGDISPDAHRQRWVMTPITNGFGAGLTLEQALSHGILELIQRDGDGVTFRALDQGVVIDLDEVRDPDTQKLLRHLDAEGIDVFPKLAATDFDIPVIYVVGADRDLSRAPFSLSLSACGEAAHPDRERALAKALREFISSRARKHFMHGPLDEVARVAPDTYMRQLFSTQPGGDEERALNSVLEWVRMPREEFYDIIRDPIFGVRSRVPFSQLPTVEPSSVAEAPSLLRLLSERLAAENLEILYVEFAPAETGVHVVKAIVPGLEVETISYGRIGRRNLERLLARGSDIVGLGDQVPAGKLRIHLSADDERELGGVAWLDPQAVDHAVGKLYGLYREPNGHTVARILENR